jgi:hypothetical protein
MLSRECFRTLTTTKPPATSVRSVATPPIPKAVSIRAAAPPAPVPVSAVPAPQIHPLLSSHQDVIVISDDDTEEEAGSVTSSTDSEDDCFISVDAPKRGLPCKRVRAKPTVSAHKPVATTKAVVPSAAPAAKRLRREGSFTSMKLKRAGVPRTRVLVCAASNAAVDEIVTRLLALVKRLPDGDDSSHSAPHHASGSENVGGGLLDAEGQPIYSKCSSGRSWRYRQLKVWCDRA